MKKAIAILIVLTQIIIGIAIYEVQVDIEKLQTSQMILFEWLDYKENGDAKNLNKLINSF